MHLQGKIAASHSVEKVEADGELVTEAGINKLAEQFPRMKEREIAGGQFNPDVAKTKQQTVLLGYAIKTPGMIWSIFWEIAYFFHPVPAPRTGIEIRNHAKGPVRGTIQTLADRRSGD